MDLKKMGESLSYKFELNMSKDIDNRVGGCNKISHGYNWLDNVAPEYQDIAQSLVNKNYNEASDILVPFLKKTYQDKQEIINNTVSAAINLFEQKFEPACLCMEDHTQNTIYRKDFTMFLTTFPRGPYNYETGALRLYIFRDIRAYLRSFLHELQHFQLIHYYKDSLLETLLSDSQFEFLKESLTVTLNDACKDFLYRPDCGYPIHQQLRAELFKYWLENKDFTKTVAYGAELVKKYTK